MDRYLDEKGNFVSRNPEEKKDLGIKQPPKKAVEHNEKAVEANKSKTPLDEEKEVVKEDKKGLFSKKKKSTK